MNIFLLIVLWILCCIVNLFYVFASGIIIYTGTKLARPGPFLLFFGIVILSGPFGTLVALADWLSTFYYQAKTLKGVQLMARDQTNFDFEHDKSDYDF